MKSAVANGDQWARQQGIDLIYSSSGIGISAHFIAAGLQRRLKIPWVQEYRDLWARNPWRSIKPYWWRDCLEQYWERKFLRQSQRVITVNEHNAETLAARHPVTLRGRIRVIRNGFDPEECTATMSMPSGPVLRLSYTGALYGGQRDLSGLFEAFAKLSKTKNLKPGSLQFVYAGPDGRTVERLARTYGTQEFLHNVNRVSDTQARCIQASSNALVFVEKADNDPSVLANVPGKAYEYLGADRPILALVHPESLVAKIILETRTGTVHNPKDVEAIALQIDAMMGTLRLHGHLPHSPDCSLLRKYCWDELARELGCVLTEAMSIVREPSECE